ncbi:MAG: hypothetical protein GY839_14605 [candidate division Zixibacteria bacterium]|nr:hypothetical protein [candidate division Zixibacteria bacterium]
MRITRNNIKMMSKIYMIFVLLIMTTASLIGEIYASDVKIPESVTLVPSNDLCEDAELIEGPYPVSGTGTNIDATVDCPTLLNWNGVWYTIELPYAINDISITICGITENLSNTGIALTDDCACDDYISVTGITFLDEGQCSSGFDGIELTFNGIPGDINEDSLAYWPALAENEEGQAMDFAYTVNITEGVPPPQGDNCADPIIIPSFPYSDTLNSCDFNNDHNFGGEDVVYQFDLDTCSIMTFSLCQTDPIFDTYLLLYNSDCGETPIKTNDDSCMAPGEYGTSELIDTLEAGIYHIIVDAYSWECGQYILDVWSEPCVYSGACCVLAECIGTMTQAGCDSFDGEWFIAEDCAEDYSCPGSCLEYLPGDANMYNGSWPPGVIGGDVTYLVNYFRGMPASQPCFLDSFWGSADANGDCNIIGSDVTKLVAYFRGVTSLGYCIDYETCWPIPEDVPVEAPADWPNCESSGPIGY